MLIIGTTMVMLGLGLAITRRGSAGTHTFYIGGGAGLVLLWFWMEANR